MLLGVCLLDSSICFRPCGHDGHPLVKLSGPSRQGSPDSSLVSSPRLNESSLLALVKAKLIAPCVYGRFCARLARHRLQNRVSNLVGKHSLGNDCYRDLDLQDDSKRDSLTSVLTRGINYAIIWTLHGTA